LTLPREEEKYSQPEYNNISDTPKLISNVDEKIFITDVTVGKQLGEGCFGAVFKGEKFLGGKIFDQLLGTWQGTTTVALKKPKDDEDIASFMAEANILM
jgi:predicted Ser/Thr protein kinase